MAIFLLPTFFPKFKFWKVSTFIKSNAILFSGGRVNFGWGQAPQVCFLGIKNRKNVKFCPMCEIITEWNFEIRPFNPLKTSFKVTKRNSKMQTRNLFPRCTAWTPPRSITAPARGRKVRAHYSRCTMAERLPAPGRGRKEKCVHLITGALRVWAERYPLQPEKEKCVHSVHSGKWGVRNTASPCC